MDELAKILNIQIQDNKFEIKFPNVGQLIDIESRKSLLASGQYKNMDKNDSFIIPYIDTLATFMVLIPELSELLRIQSLFDLSLLELKELLNIYNNQYLPWYNSWMDLIKK